MKSRLLQNGHVFYFTIKFVLSFPLSPFLLFLSLFLSLLLSLSLSLPLLPPALVKIREDVMDMCVMVVVVFFYLMRNLNVFVADALGDRNFLLLVKVTLATALLQVLKRVAQLQTVRSHQTLPYTVSQTHFLCHRFSLSVFERYRRTLMLKLAIFYLVYQRALPQRDCGLFYFGRNWV